jgi:hypothetical protein
MKRNEDTLAGQYRQQPPIEYLRGINVTTGKLMVYSAVCPCCGEDRNYTEYYWVKRTSKQFQNDFTWVRKPICVVCWNKDTNTRSGEKGYRTNEYKEMKERQKIIEYFSRKNNLEGFIS